MHQRLCPVLIDCITDIERTLNVWPFEDVGETSRAPGGLSDNMRLIVVLPILERTIMHLSKKHHRRGPHWPIFAPE